jgi:hypothetical protein
MFGYKRELINPDKYKQDKDGIIHLDDNRPVYVHSDIRQVEVDEEYVTGYKDVPYTQLESVPTGKKQSRRIKKKRNEYKQVPVEKTRIVKRRTVHPTRRAVTTTTTGSTLGIIEHSHLQRYIPTHSSSYGQGWTYRYVPARYGRIPTQSTTTNYVNDYSSSEEEVEEKYTVLEWQNVETEYSTDEEVDVVDLRYVNKIKKEPIKATRKVIKSQREYSFTCACKGCLCPKCVYKSCTCTGCTCKQCSSWSIAIYASICVPAIMTGIFIGIIPIVLGVEAMIDEWPGLTSGSLNYGFVIAIFGVSILIAAIVSVLWFLSNRDIVASRLRVVTISLIMWAIVTVQLTSLCTFAAVPLITWWKNIDINVLPCYIIGGSLIIVYATLWIILVNLRNRFYKHTYEYIDI